jgi:type VI secretion system protein ImpM
MTGKRTDGVGFFGKLPSHGDFLSRRLPRDFTDPWDRWLQSVIANSKEQLADSWLEVYLTSPLWRFVTSNGVCGHGVWAGVLMPSVDRVGRYFPLTLATALPEDCNPVGLLSEADAWFQALEDLALSTLNDNFSLEGFEQGLLALKLPEISATPTEALQQRSGKSAWHFAAPSSINSGHTLQGVNQVLLKKLLPAHSLWWSQGSERVEPSLLIAEGLPPVECFAGLLDGEWARWGWGEYRLPLSPTAVKPTQEESPDEEPVSEHHPLTEAD